MKTRARVLLLVTAITAALGCTQANPNATPCRDIPRNGCPILTDDAECEDPACAAAYACTDGAWTFKHTCPGFVDGGHLDAAAPASPDAGAGSCLDAAAFDAPPGAGGGAGCDPLVAPDCPLSRALSCDPASASACSECDSFFACEQGAWIFWGGCSPDGSVTLTN